MKNKKGFVQYIGAGLIGLILIFFVVLPLAQQIGFMISGEQQECKELVGKFDQQGKELSQCQNDILDYKITNGQLSQDLADCKGERDNLQQGLNNCTQNYNDLVQRYNQLTGQNVTLWNTYFVLFSVKIYVIYAIIFSLTLGILLTINLIEITHNIEIKIGDIEISKEAANTLLFVVLGIIVILIILSHVGWL